MSTVKYRFELQGISPLLLHADDVLKADALEEWRKDPANKKTSKPGDDRSPSWTWQTYLYVDERRDMLVIPSDNIQAALRHGAAQIVMKRQKTFKAASQSGLLIDGRDEDSDGLCEFEGNGATIAYSDLEKFRDKPFQEHLKRVEDLGFSLYVKRARVGKAKHVRVRARFEEWRIFGTVQVLDDSITLDVLTRMFQYAGQYSGLCDWRPSSKESPGRFGMFTSSLKRI
jgi:hypothetical protein